MGSNQLETFELGEQNILEEFYDLIEKHRTDSSKDFQLGDFYDYLTEFDLSYQEFNVNREGDIAVVYIDKYLRQSLYVFLVLFKFRGFSDRPLFYAFKRFIYWFKLVLNNNKELNSEFFFSKNITENFPSLFKGEYFEFLKEMKINFNLYKPENFNEHYELFNRAEAFISIDFGVGYYRRSELKTKFLVFGDEFSVSEFYINNKTEKFKKGEVHYELMLDIELSNDDNDGSKLITALSLILNSISNIENVKVEIEDIRTGSIYARVRVYIKDLVAKEEVKAVLEVSKEVVVKAVTGGQVSVAETRKVIAETKKIKAEQESIERETATKPDEFEAKISKALDLEKKALENEQLKVQVTKEKLEVMDRLSDLAAKGILSVDEIRMDINEILYLLKSGDSIQASEADIDNIA